VCDVCVQARQVLEREFNNLLALGTERNLAEVRLYMTLTVHFVLPWLAVLPFCICTADFSNFVCGTGCIIF